MENKKSPSFLTNGQKRLIFFGGKGGVGKTTTAAASAIFIARQFPQKKVLVLSTDPAHSLSDCFEILLNDEVSSINGLSNLFARELDAARLLDAFKDKNEKIIKVLAERGTYFDNEDIESFFSLSLPGMDEVMAVIEIYNLFVKGEYETIIIDTAPTGHTMRLLLLPNQLEQWIDLFNLMQEKHRIMTRRFSGRYAPDEADKFLEDLTHDLKEMRSLLSNPAITEFVPITIPEKMSFNETCRLLGVLRDCHMPVRNIIVNNVIKSESCEYCQKQYEAQKSAIEKIRNLFKDFNIMHMPLYPKEVRGVNALSEFAGSLVGEEVNFQGMVHRSKRSDGDQRIKLERFLNDDLQMLLVGGKGGVGKTSIATALALKFSGKYPDKKVLLFSTDPAHSLSDSLGQEIGNKVTQVQARPLASNLFAIEINAEKLFDDFAKKYKREIDDVFDGFFNSSSTAGMDFSYDRSLMKKLINVSPPGLDELMALKEIMNYIDKDTYDFYILDTAPTGHLLRFLELPSLVQGWLKAIFRLLIKYEGMVNLNSVAEKMVELSKSVKRIKAILCDSKRAKFLAVTIPEAMGFEETKRLVDSLHNLDIACTGLVINKIFPSVKCGFCGIKRDEQLEYAKKIEKKLNIKHVARVPLFPSEIVGVEKLTKFGDRAFY